jgi:hypothetical protein
VGVSPPVFLGVWRWALAHRFPAVSGERWDLAHRFSVRSLRHKERPDWNPDEKVWNHLKRQEWKGYQAKPKSEPTQLAIELPPAMASDPESLRGIFSVVALLI